MLLALFAARLLAEGCFVLSPLCGLFDHHQATRDAVGSDIVECAQVAGPLGCASIEPLATMPDAFAFCSHHIAIADPPDPSESHQITSLEPGGTESVIGNDHRLTF